MTKIPSRLSFPKAPRRSISVLRNSNQHWARRSWQGQGRVISPHCCPSQAGGEPQGSPNPAESSRDLPSTGMTQPGQCLHQGWQWALSLCVSRVLFFSLPPQKQRLSGVCSCGSGKAINMQTPGQQGFMLIASPVL